MRRMVRIGQLPPLLVARNHNEGEEGQALRTMRRTTTSLTGPTWAARPAFSTILALVCRDSSLDHSQCRSVSDNKLKGGLERPVQILQMRFGRKSYEMKTWKSKRPQT